MDITYRYAESTVRPDAIQINADTVYLRKDISEIIRDDNQENKISYWTYQEAAMTVEEFNQNASAILIAGQKNGDDNLLAVMEAIADLYETIATMM